MRALAAIVVGIGGYQYGDAHFPTLRYASRDADEFVRYITTCWTNTEEVTLLRIEEQDATLQSLTDAFAKLSEQGPFDLQIVFLSGHGFVDENRAGFVLQPSAASKDLNQGTHRLRNSDP